MNENLDLTEILKDCLTGTEFYSSIYGNVKFRRIREGDLHPIEFDIVSSGECDWATSDGRHLHKFNGECTFFPSKDQRDWNKWNRPFVDGDIVHGNNNCCSYISIYKSDRENNSFHYYASLSTYGGFKTDDYADKRNLRFATEEEKQKLFDAIKSRGYKWDDKTKILEKLIEPKFKVGDVIRSKNGLQAYKIINVTSEYYSTKVPNHACVGLLPVKDQNDWILISNKFDPKTLQPFDSIIVRDFDNQKWMACLFSHIENGAYHKFKTVAGLGWYQCIPFNNDTKHLVGKIDNAPEFYRYWEK